MREIYSIFHGASPANGTDRQASIAPKNFWREE
jgi:hypothetical protein